MGIRGCFPIYVEVLGNEPMVLKLFNCKELLVFVEAFSFCYTINAGPSLELGYPVVALHHGDPAALVLQDRSLHMLQKITNGEVLVKHIKSGLTRQIHSSIEAIDKHYMM
ncbi:hypothetical protein STEG23_030076 [Scotinomys teguina]